MAGMGEVAERDRIEELFSALAADRLEEFRLGCSGKLLISLRGTSNATTTLSLRQLPEWWEGLRSLTGGSLGVEVVLTMATGAAHLVVLRHTFILDGTTHRYDTVNTCTFRDERLVAWFSRPLDRREYADAWGILDPEPGAGEKTAGMVGSAMARVVIADRHERIRADRYREHPRR